MRGRFLLFAALFLLALLPPAQAESLRDWTDAADEAMPGVVKDAICVDVSTLWDDPASVVVIAAQCTVGVSVRVYFNDEGHLVVTVVVAYAEFGYTCALDTADPGNLPRVGDAIVWEEPCWRQLQRWMT